MTIRANRPPRELTYVRFPERTWRRPPALSALRICDRSIACPREALRAIVDASDVSYAGLSRMLGKRSGYLACFVREGHPRALAALDHQRLADFFGVDQRRLGVRELWA